MVFLQRIICTHTHTKPQSQLHRHGLVLKYYKLNIIITISFSVSVPRMQRGAGTSRGLGPIPCSEEVQAEQVAQGFVQSSFKSLKKKPVPIYYSRKVSCPTTSVIPMRSWFCNCTQTFNFSCLLPVLPAFVFNLLLLSGERQRIPRTGHATATF